MIEICAIQVRFLSFPYPDKDGPELHATEEAAMPVVRLRDFDVNKLEAAARNTRCAMRIAGSRLS